MNNILKIPYMLHKKKIILITVSLIVNWSNRYRNKHPKYQVSKLRNQLPDSEIIQLISVNLIAKERRFTSKKFSNWAERMSAPYPMTF